MHEGFTQKYLQEQRIWVHDTHAMYYDGGSRWYVCGNCIGVVCDDQLYDTRHMKGPCNSMIAGEITIRLPRKTP